MYSIINRIGAKLKLKADLEGNAEHVTCMDRLHHQCMKTVLISAK